MKYSKVKYILESLKPYTIEKLDTELQNNNIVNISFLDKQTVLKSDTIYISVLDNTFSILENAIIYPSTIIICCNKDLHIPKDSGISAFVYIVDCDHMFIYNLMNDILSKYRDFHSFVTFVQIEDLSAEQILRSAESKFKKRFYYLTEKKVMIAGHDTDDNQKLINAMLRLGDMQPIDESSGIDDRISCKKYITEDRIVVLSDLSAMDEGMGKLALVTGLNDMDDNQTLALSVARCVSLSLRSKNRIDTSAPNGFEQFIMNVLSSDHNDAQELQHMSGAFQLPVKKYWQIVIAKYENDLTAEQPMSVLGDEIQYAFPDSNIAIYRDRVVMLLTYDEDTTMPPQYMTRLETLLMNHSAIAAEGISFSNPAHFKNQFRILSRGIDLCSVLKVQSSTRIFNYNLCKTYYITDLALSAYQKNYNSFDFTQLIHKDIVAVYNYDKINNSNLLDVLYIYLINNQNVNTTGSWLYVHRNTVRNRINQIKEIISSNMDDPGVQFELLFSCFIIRYISRYLNLNIS